MNEPAHIPPRLPLRFLRWFCHPGLLEDVEGDLTELFCMRVEERPTKARLLFWMDVLLLFRPGIVKNLHINGLIHFSMFKNFSIIALRNALKYKGYTLLNLSGLIVGIAASVLILLWVNDEVSINQYHPQGDQVYQLFRNMRQSNGQVQTTWSVPKPAGDLIREEYPEVESVASLSWPILLQMEKGEESSKHEGLFATPSFLELFSYPLAIGDSQTALDQLNSIIISKNLALRFFGADWRDQALGQTFKVFDPNNPSQTMDAIVSGVFERPNPYSTYEFEWMMPAELFYNINSWVDDWGNGSFAQFLSIPEKENVPIVANRVVDEITTHTQDNSNAGNEQLVLQKFEDTYLYSNFENGVPVGGRITYVRIMTVVAILLLVVACINFMNLTTAQANRRSKEVGLRKVMGAHKRLLRLQFYFEAYAFVTIAMVISILLVMLLLPWFNGMVEKSLIVDFSQLKTWYFLLGLLATLGLVSGSYPALLLPNFNIILSLKGIIKQAAFGTYFRKALVIFQFAISALLIIGTTVIQKQLSFIMNKDLGLDRENMVVVRMQGDMNTRIETYQTELRRIPEVKGVSAVSGNPLTSVRSTSSANWEGKDPNEGYELQVIMSDEYFIETAGMQMQSGRVFSTVLEDSTSYIVNETAARLMGFEDPLNKSFSIWGIEGKIIGVVKDFHTSDFYEPIAPLVITCFDLGMTRRMLIKIDGHPAEALQAIEEVTADLNPGYDFEYEFLDESYAELYSNERTASQLVNIFAVIAIFISCLGIYGLAAYSADQRSREIGVRKVHGASISQILVMLSKDYAWLMLWAFILAVPFGYFVTRNWLDNFEFRVDLDPLIFIASGAIVFVIGVATVTAKSYTVAADNPVNSLRDE